MRKIGWSLALLMLLVVSAASAADIKIKHKDWAGGVFVPLSPDGKGFLRTLDEENSVLRAAELRNPGLLEQLFNTTRAGWIRDGRVSVQQDGTINFGGQHAYDALNAEWRAVLIREMRPYLENIETALTQEQLLELDVATYVNRETLAPLPKIDKVWYKEPSMSPLADLNETTVCYSCLDPQDSGPCAGGCTEGCALPSSDCAHVEVPLLDRFPVVFRGVLRR